MRFFIWYNKIIKIKAFQTCLLSFTLSHTLSLSEMFYSVSNTKTMSTNTNWRKRYWENCGDILQILLSLSLQSFLPAHTSSYHHHDWDWREIKSERRHKTSSFWLTNVNKLRISLKLKHTEQFTAYYCCWPPCQQTVDVWTQFFNHWFCLYPLKSETLSANLSLWGITWRTSN